MIIGHQKTKTGHKFHFAIEASKGHIMKATILCSHRPNYDDALKAAKDHIITHTQTHSGEPVKFATAEQAAQLGDKNEIYL
jgi:hypothetical protein